MCGIAGIVQLNDTPVSQTDLKLMAFAVRHRGPDGEGIYIHQQVGLAHRRLAIIDLTEAGHQPMVVDDCVLTYNGEIYNYLELREELRLLGHHFNTATDAEVLLKAYKHWGFDCVNHFNGMWSFAIHDVKNNLVFCSRDRFGKKPFFYTFSKQRFIFCSEIKGILPVIDAPRPNWETLTQFVVLNQTDTNGHSFFEGIEKLPAGHNGILQIETGAFQISPYYKIARLKPGLDDEASIIHQFQREFDRSVTWRLRSDVLVGTCLSGGLDSSYLTAVAAKKYQTQNGNPFSAITAGSVDPQWDETGYAKKVVDHCGLQWIQTLPGKQDFLDDFENVVLMQEEPFHSTSVFMQYFVMKAAKAAGVKVLLDGQGADEILMGYHNHIALYLRRLPLAQRLKAANEICHNYSISKAYLLQLYFYFNNGNLIQQRQLLRWKNLKQDIKNTCLNKAFNHELIQVSKGPLFDYQCFDIYKNSLPKLLRYEDKNAMAFSIETRLPFLDFGVVETALNAPEALRLNHGWSKYILRKAMEKALPADIVWRKKKLGFVAPDSIWLADDSHFKKLINNSQLLRQMFTTIDYPTHDYAAAWRLISVAAWEKTFNLKI